MEANWYVPPLLYLPIFTSQALPAYKFNKAMHWIGLD